MNDERFKQYRKKQVSEMRPYELGESLVTVSIGQRDRSKGSPKPGDMIVRNPANPVDQWLISSEYFVENFVQVDEGEDF